MQTITLAFLWVSTLHVGTVMCQSSCDPSWTFFCDDGTCIPNARRCNSRIDCRNGEDEVECVENSPCRRYPLQSEYNGYHCSTPCSGPRDCAGNEQCRCDDECGRSCIVQGLRCGNPPSLKNSVGHSVVRFHGRDRTTIKTTNYRFGDMIEYECIGGMNFTGPMPRCSSNGQWTNGKPQCTDFSKCGQAGWVRLKNLNPVLDMEDIVHGKDAKDSAWPWYAMISKRRRTSYLTFSACSMLGGGSLINKNWVLTAAHPFSSFSQSGGTKSDWVKEVIISFGVIERPQRNSFPRTMQSFMAENVVIHSRFNELSFENDIALLKLGNRIEPRTVREIPGTGDGVEFGYYIRPVCLPCAGSCFDRDIRRSKSGRPLFRRKMSEKRKCKLEGKLLLKGQAKVVVTGYGHIKAVNSYVRGCITAPQRLQQGQLAVLPNSECRASIKEINRNNTFGTPMVYNSKFICSVGKERNKTLDACQGDSGGAVVRKVANKAGTESCWVQIGIVSWGIGCATGAPGFYTNVATFAQWIKDTLEGHEDCQKLIELKAKSRSRNGDIVGTFNNPAADSNPLPRPKCVERRKNNVPGGAPKFHRKKTRTRKKGSTAGRTRKTRERRTRKKN